MEHDILTAHEAHLLPLCLAYEKHGYNAYDLFLSARALFKQLKEADRRAWSDSFIRGDTLKSLSEQ